MSCACTGLYIALAQGLYDQAGLAVEIVTPKQDAYKKTPASRVADGQAMFAVAPSETVISYNCQPTSSFKPKLKVCQQ